MTEIPATFRGTFQAAFTGPVEGSIFLTPEREQALYDDWKARNPDPVPAPPPPEPSPDPIPTFGSVYNVPADPGLMDKVRAVLAAREPVVIGPTSLDGQTYQQTLMLPKSISLAGSGYRLTTLVYRGTGPAFKSATTEQTQSLIRNFRIERNGTDDIFVINGLSNMSGLEGIDLRGGRDQILLLPGVDKSTAFMGHLFNLFSFNATGSVIHAKAGNGAAKHLCRLNMSKLDIGRCNGPVMLFEDCLPTGSHIALTGVSVDMAQGEFSSPHAVQFKRSGDTSFSWIGGNVAQVIGKDIIVSDVPHAEDAWTIRGVQMRNDPRPGFEKYPRFQIKTPTLQIPGDANGGMCNWPQ